MKRSIQIVIDNTKVRGNVTPINPETMMVKLKDPEIYSCEAICQCDINAENAENLLTTLFRMVSCVNDILQNDHHQLSHLWVQLHHARSRTKLLANSMEIVERLFENNEIPRDDVRLLCSVIKGEKLYYEMQKVKVFNDCFKEDFGRWEFQTIPICVIQLLSSFFNTQRICRFG